MPKWWSQSLKRLYPLLQDISIRQDLVNADIENEANVTKKLLVLLRSCRFDIMQTRNDHANFYTDLENEAIVI